MAGKASPSRKHRIWPQYRQYLRYSHGDLRWFGVECLLLVLIAATNTAMIWLIGQPFNLISQHQYDAILPLAWLFAALVVCNQSIHFANNILVDWIGMRFMHRLRNAVFAKVLSLQHPQAVPFERGDLLNRLNQDIARLQEFVVNTPFYMVSALSILVFYIYMMVAINWHLALLALAASPIFFLHHRLFAPRQRRLTEIQFKQEGDFQGFEQQALANLLGISSFNAGEALTREHSGRFKQWMCTGIKRSVLNSGFSASLMSLIYFLGAVMVALGVVKMGEGTLAPGELVSFLIFLGYLSVPLQTLAQVRFANEGMLASAHRINAIQHLQAFVQDPAQVHELPIRHADIRFENVSFSYPDGTNIFNSISVTIHGGETVALVGPSGAGKTTFALLLARYFDPTAGDIFIDDCDLKKSRVSDLRNAIGICWQQGFFMPDTIRANLLLAKPEATEQELVAACQNAQAWLFIDNLPLRLDTRLAADGTNLSAGQAQRINLAQVLLKNSPILILDEASSALDSATEKRLAEAVEFTRHGRTTLLIAHRYSSLRAARRVIYFNGNGTITVGDHEHLYAEHAGYKQAVDWQIQQAKTN